jgi:predicted nicotinamide N-methyase
LRLLSEYPSDVPVVFSYSHHLLNFILPQLYFPASFTDPPPLLPDPQSLNVVELGSGCGLAAVAFSRFFRRYTCTDQFDCLKNLEANLVSNGLTVEYGEGWAESSSGDGKRTVGLKELDWVELVQQQLPSGNKASSASTSTHSASILPSSAIYDIILAADCIYNPFLILPFLSTIAHLSEPNHTVVLVAIELRSQEVTEEFLAAWLEETETRGAWEVWRIKDFQPDGGSVHALWAAWRKR